jgi:uncharacterized protein (DUF924 family)
MTVIVTELPQLGNHKPPNLSDKAQQGSNQACWQPPQGLSGFNMSAEFANEKWPMYTTVLSFWFAELTPAQWWRVDPELDAMICSRFADLHEAALAGELQDWRSSAEGRLAEIIVLDQFSRNIHRGTARAFAADGMALVLAQEWIAQGLDLQLSIAQRGFAYLPYMHSESKAIHAKAEQLFMVPGLELNLKAELKHKVIIDRFGRYPHRNALLGRASTPEELQFLTEPGSSF